MLERIVNAPRWLLLVTLIYAPWAYGATLPWTATVLNILLGSILVLWVAGCLARSSWPVIPSAPKYAALFLCLQAGWMVLNAQSDYDTSTFTFIPLSPFLKSAPGTLHRALSLPAALSTTLLLGVGCFCCDLARRPIWKKRLLFTMALTGVSIVLLGLAERLSGAEGIFWGAANEGDTFFATFRYHANAGSYLNLVWPIIAGLLFAAFKREEERRLKIFLVAALVMSLAGVFVNASRAANLIAMALMVAWGAWIWLQMRRDSSHRALHPAYIVVAVLVLVMIVAGVAAFGGLDTSLRRWGKFDEELTSRNPRLLVAQICMRMIPNAGLLGFGPATFQTAFPYYTKELGEEISGVWLYAHDDYLQTLVEWGWAGSLFWAIYILGGVVFSLLTVLRHRHQISPTDRIMSFAIISAVTGLLVHASMDFPLQVPSIQLYLAALLGMLWSCRSWIAKQDLLKRLEKRTSPSSHLLAVR